MTEGFILGVDLDGVCGDYTEVFRQVVAEDRGVDPSSLSDIRSWDFAEWNIPTPEEFDRLHRLAVLEVKRQGVEVVGPAPESFQDLAY